MIVKQIQLYYNYFMNRLRSVSLRGYCNKKKVIVISEMTLTITYGTLVNGRKCIVFLHYVNSRKQYTHNTAEILVQVS